jgi:hypothetical protein
MYSLFFNAAARREQTDDQVSQPMDEQQILTLAVYATLVAVAVIAYIS